MEKTVTRHSKETISITTTTTTTKMPVAAEGQQVEAAKKTQETAELPSYNDFEPFWTWHREEDKDTLVVKLPEFKVEELKLRINNSGELTISGERPIINGKGRVRFTQEVKMSKNYDAGKITAKFTRDGFLHVALPKKIPNSQSAADVQAKVGGEGGRAGAADLQLKVGGEGAGAGPADLKPKVGGEGGREGAGAGPADLQPIVGGESGWTGSGPKLALSVAVAAAAALAVSVYATFKGGTSSSNAG